MLERWQHNQSQSDRHTDSAIPQNSGTADQKQIKWTFIKELQQRWIANCWTNQRAIGTPKPSREKQGPQKYGPYCRTLIKPLATNQQLLNMWVNNHQIENGGTIQRIYQYILKIT